MVDFPAPLGPTSASTSPGPTWNETSAVHEEAQSTGGIAQEQQRAIESSRSSKERLEPIRNRGERVGRNEPCPCGSGKKYKNCRPGPGRAR